MRISERLFQLLMLAYPGRFRTEYGRLMLRHFVDTNDGGIRHWVWILTDTATSASHEHLAQWREHMSKITLIAAGILVLPFGFVLVNVLQYEIGIPVPWNPYDSVYDQVGGTGWNFLFDALILFSPVAALLMVFLSQVRFSRGQDKPVIARVEIQRASTLAYIVVGTSLALLGVMGLYLVFENLPCLLGQQVVC